MNNSREILSMNLKYYRQKYNLSQEKFAEKVGSNLVYINELEADLNYYIFRYYSPCITTKWINRGPMEEKLVLFSFFW